jgi:hypothetical protein
MTRKEARELADKHSFRETLTNRYITSRRVVYIIIDALLENIDAENRSCENCKYSVKFPIFNMQCHRDNDEYNPLFEIGIYPEFCCNKWESN